jgi:putative ABC transport system permease protein
VDNLINDIRFGVRSLMKRRASTVVALIALALGIGINTALFSVVDAVLLRPLPVRDPGSVVSVWEHGLGFRAERNELAPANFIDIQKRTQTFEQIGAFGNTSFNLSADGEPERLEGQQVSANVLSLLGVQPVLGRTFLSGEDQPGNHRVVVLSNALWERRFQKNQEIVGRPITLDGQSFTVVGVMPKGFFFADRETQLWTPLAMEADQASGRGDHYLRAVGRLKPGITQQQANHDLATIAAQLEKEYPRTNEGLGFIVTSLRDDYVGDIRKPLLLMLAAVGVVLLIACANVANLLLAQTAARRREISIRAALGAKRWTIVRQFLVESLLLALIGGLIGLLVAIWTLPLLLKSVPESLSQIQDVRLDLRVLGFTMGVTLITGLLFGIFPALQASRAKPAETLKQDLRTGIHGFYTRRALLVSQVALALILLVSAGLLLRSLQRLSNVDPGFSTTNLLTLRMVVPNSKYPTRDKRRVFYDEVISRVKAVPGVESAGIISFLPLSFGGMSFSFTVEGLPPQQDANLPGALYRVVSPDYFHTMGISLQHGRSFDVHDSADAPAAVVINRRLADEFWPNENPIGKRLKVGSADSPNPWATVIGVVNNVRQAGLYGDHKFELYAPYAQDPRGFTTPRDLIVRTKAETSTLAPAIRAAIWSVDKDQPVSNIRTMDQVFNQTISRERFQTLLLTLFAGMALILACIGLYGLISYAVSQRTHEIGVRIALGAQRADVLRLVIKEGMLITIVGLALGLGCALAITRLLSGMLYDIATTDTVTFISVPAFLIFVAFVACYIPARRATKVDPLEALRYE